MLSLERRNLQVHSVCPFEDWGKLIGDVPAATAILDRFLHHAELITMTGRSYRLRHQTDHTSDNPKPANAPTGSPVQSAAAVSKSADPPTRSTPDGTPRRSNRSMQKKPSSAPTKA
jgi:hypothetical protein